MKISVSWLLDHIDCKSVSELGKDLEQLMLKFNQRVAEIEHFALFKLNPENFFAAKIKTLNAEQATLQIAELNKEITLASRTDGKLERIFLVTLQSNKTFTWTTLNDIELKKDGLVPELLIPENELSGSWKKNVDWNDAILEVDNKSITHRPDMWSHRGFAREIALLCNKDLIEAEDKLAKLSTSWGQASATENSDLSGHITIKNLAQDGCKYFCAAKFENVETKPSIPKMAFRLARVGLRPINAIVDLTNYLTADWGQPVHAYDASQIPDGELIVRKANPNEYLTLLDNQNIELHKDDLVIATNQEAIALAGVMGGKDHSISQTTNSIIFESANFVPNSIRHSAQRHKLRTESSARFEKTLHRNLALEGVLRFAALAQAFKINLQLKGSIICLGKPDEQNVIAVDHNFLEQKIGVSLRESDIINPLEALGFTVEIDHSDEALGYKIKVPDFRSSKDVKIPEDIVEEIARCFGFEKITPKIPTFEKHPYDSSGRTKMYAVKNFLANGANMVEQCNYNFFNIDFIKKLDFTPEKTLSVKNPVNENTVQLITSMVPGLLANIVKNYSLAEKLAFFECGKVWNVLSDQEHTETATIAGIFWHKRSDVNFFECKEVLQQIFKIFELNSEDTTWSKLRQTTLPWQHPYATAKIEHKSKLLGFAGKVDHKIWAKLDCLPSTDAFYFELNLDMLKKHKAPLAKGKPLPKNQEQSFDLAFIADDSSTSQEFIAALKKVDKSVCDVVLIDSFRKNDWQNKRSLAFRVKLQSLADEPINRVELEKICQRARETVFSMGAEIRG